MWRPRGRGLGADRRGEAERMSIIDALRSQAINFSAFRAFFPFPRTLLDIARMPLEYASGGVARPFPLVVDVTATNRCNLRCDFCYNQDNHTTRQDELSADELRRLFDEAATWRAGVFLTGGEPLLRRDLVELIAAAKSRGLPVGLVSNGAPGSSRATAERIDELAEAGLDVAVVSVHGSAAVHDQVVGQAGAFASAMQSLERLSKRTRSRPLVNIVLSPRALPGLDELLERLAGMDVRPRLAHLSFLTPEEQRQHEEAWPARVGGPAPRLLNYLVDEDELAAITETLPELRRQMKTGLWSEPVLSAQELEQWYAPRFGLKRRCLFVWQSTVINADGSVYPCQYYAQSMGNIREEPLAKIWNGPRYRALRKALKKGLLPGCARCCKL
jgi:MoaA/NifB/PqqE/SkfB family radical SAM enzyme